MQPTRLDAEQITQDVIDKYQRFVNPTQVALLSETDTEVEASFAG